MSDVNVPTEVHMYSGLATNICPKWLEPRLAPSAPMCAASSVCGVKRQRERNQVTAYGHGAVLAALAWEPQLRPAVHILPSAGVLCLWKHRQTIFSYPGGIA